MKLQFSTDNAAFQDYPYPHMETARTLEQVAEKIRQGETSGNIRDSNGNTIGTFEV